MNQNYSPRAARDRFGSLSAGEILLAGDEIAVANGKSAPKSSLDVIRADLLYLVLDSPWHHMLITREKVHGPYRVVGVVVGA